MAHRSKIIKEWVDVQITAANESFKQSFEVDKHAAVIIGIDLSSDYEDALYHRGSQRISINDMEIYPEGYESKKLFQDSGVATNDRIIKLGEEIAPGNRKVEIEYRDTDHPAANFRPYRVRLYVYSRLEHPGA